VVAELGDSIEVAFLSSYVATSFLETKANQTVDVKTRIVAFKTDSVWHKQIIVSILFHDGVSSRQPLFYKCPSLKGGENSI
jgi:hypothetical protein